MFLVKYSNKHIDKGHSLFLKLLYSNILSTIPQFFRSYGAHTIRVVVVVVDVTVIVHIAYVVSVAWIRRGQPGNYAPVLFIFFSQPDIYFIISSIFKPNFIYFLLVIISLS